MWFHIVILYTVTAHIITVMIRVREGYVCYSVHGVLRYIEGEVHGNITFLFNI